MVAIKDMKMPESCAYCDFCVEDKYADMTCVLLGLEWEETDYNEIHRDENCPLVEIGTCKDCRWLTTDDDGNYYCRQTGCFDSLDFYCADYEKRGSENDI